jgi:hypothetical protein
VLKADVERRFLRGESLGTLVRLGALGIIAWILARYLADVGRYAINVPLLDDYDAVLAFINRVATRQGASEVVADLLRQHNEHRLVVPRIVFLLDYLIEDQVDFRHLSFVGNAGLVATFAVLWATARCRRPILMLPVAAVIFHEALMDSATWAMVAVQTFLVLFFAFACMGLLSIPRRACTIAAATCAVLAVYTQANGMFLFPAVAWVLVKQRRMRALTLFACVGLVSVPPYFLGYARPPEHPSAATAVTEPLRFIRWLLTLLGAPLESEDWSLVFGLLVAGVVPVIFLGSRRRVAHTESSLVGLFVFLFLTCVSIAVGRAGFDPSLAFASRYRIVVVALYAVAYLMVVGRVQDWTRWRAGVLSGVIVASLVFNQRARIASTPFLEERRNALLSSLVRVGASLWHPDAGRAKRIFDESVRLGTYRPPRVRLIRTPDSSNEVAVIDDE